MSLLLSQFYDVLLQSTCCKFTHCDVITGADTWRDKAVNTDQQQQQTPWQITRGPETALSSSYWFNGTIYLGHCKRYRATGPHRATGPESMRT